MPVCTIIASNYVAAARVLAESVARHHPEVDFYTLVIDGEEPDRRLTGLGHVLLPGDLPLPLEQWQQMAAIYSVMELATAIKPTVLQHLLDRGPTVTYLDPDIQVLHPLTGCFEAAARSSIALTPHCLFPVPRDGLEPSERTLMLAGIYNLGFISVGQRSRPFLRWWHQRLRHDAVVDVAAGLFTDQRWVDWVPALFEHEILRDPGLNVAYWNVHERDLRLGPDGELLTGSGPVSFFHFSGFLPAFPTELSKHAPASPRVVLSEHPAVAALCDRYTAALDRHGHADHCGRPYRLDRLANGALLTPYVRRALRTAYLDGERVPNPFADPDGCRAWLAAAVGGPPAPIARWEQALWAARPDLQSAFPDLVDDAAALRAWLDHDPWAQLERARTFPLTPPPGPLRPPPQQPHRTSGWSVLAYADAELGVGEAGRRMARAAQLIGLPTEVVGAGAALSRRRHLPSRHLATTASFDNSISCVNADQLAQVWRQTGVHPDGPGARVALWFWEVDRFPDEWLPAFELLDQVWVASEHTRRALDAYGLCPVELVTLPVLPSSTPTPHTRRSLGLPEDRTVFLCVYDFLSVLRRKNPLDVIAAYTAAFGPDDGATLVLKSINGQHRRQQLSLVEHTAAGRPDIHVRDGYCSAGELAGMVELSDCLVSLHRAEGYGLNLMDAMAVGTPVVATGYSGNLTFMDDRSALLVAYEEVDVGAGAHPYPPTARWAQPDLNAAAAALRQVVDDPVGTGQRAARARSTVLREHSLEVAGARVRSLCLELLGERLSA